MTVITISRQFGSGGDEVADRLCDLLGYRQFGKKDIVRVATEAGLSDSEIIDYSDDNYKVKHFIDRLFKWPMRSTYAEIWKEDEKGVRIPEKFTISEESALTLVQAAIKAAYKAGNMIIVGRGGMMVLKGLPNVLHVRIEADLEDRVQRIKTRVKHVRQDYYADIGSRRQAQEMIDTHDEASAEYIKQYYSANWDDISLYDLVFNTSQSSIDRVARAISEKVRSTQGQPVY
jgi:cytidylate kinase